MSGFDIVVGEGIVELSQLVVSLFGTAYRFAPERNALLSCP